MAYDYTNLQKAMQAKKDEREAREGLLPEGQYTVELRSIKRDATRAGGHPRWSMTVSIIADKSIYDGAERVISFIEMENKFGEEMMENFVSFLGNTGFSFEGISSHMDGEKKIKAWLEKLARVACSFQINVQNQQKKNPTTGEYEIDQKYQKYTICVDTVQDMTDEVQALDNKRVAKPAQPVAPAAPAKVAPKAAPAPEQYEAPEDEEEAPAPTPARKRPNPFA